MTCLLAIDLDAREKAVGTVGGGGLKRAVSCGLITGGRIFLSAPPRGLAKAPWFSQTGSPESCCPGKGEVLGAR